MCNNVSSILTSPRQLRPNLPTSSTLFIGVSCLLLADDLVHPSITRVHSFRVRFCRLGPRRRRGSPPNLRQHRHSHPRRPNQRCEYTIHGEICCRGTRELQSKPAVDRTQGDDRNSEKHVRIRPARPAPDLLECQVVEEACNRLQRNTGNDKNPDNGVVRVDVRRSLRHPHTHPQGCQGGEPREDLPRGVQPDGEAAGEKTEEHRADGEEEGEGEAAQDAVGLFDSGLEAGSGLERSLAEGDAVGTYRCAYGAAGIGRVIIFIRAAVDCGGCRDGGYM